MPSTVTASTYVPRRRGITKGEKKMMTYEDVQERIRDQSCIWLVTGTAGFIGSNLLETLLKLDQQVIGLDNFSTGSPANLAQVKSAVTDREWKNFRFIEGDIRSLNTCRRACRAAKYVLHQAALGSVPHSIEDPINCNGANVTGFVNMLVAAHDAGASRFVYASSSATYGDHPGLLKTEPEIGRLLSPYALTKYVNELYADIFARCYGFGSIGLRYFNVFGPRQDPNGAYAAVIPKWVASMIRDESVFINGDGETARDFCYIDNVVQANLLAGTVDDPAAVNQVYNIGTGEKTTLNQLFEMLRSALRSRYSHLSDLRPVYRDFRAGDVRLSQADIGKAKRLLGYRPVCQVSEGLARAVDWYVAKNSPRRSIDAEVSRPQPSSHSPIGLWQITDS
jgi:UDP-N-acetylglucosamine/UDP-N-acetylgalactosamine 4-epimerase